MGNGKMTKASPSCRHSHFWLIGMWAWCPECGGIRKLKYDVDGYLVFAWKRWAFPVGTWIEAKYKKKALDSLLDKRYKDSDNA